METARTEIRGAQLMQLPRAGQREIARMQHTLQGRGGLAQEEDQVDFGRGEPSVAKQTISRLLGSTHSVPSQPRITGQRRASVSGGLRGVRRPEVGFSGLRAPLRADGAPA